MLIKQSLSQERTQTRFQNVLVIAENITYQIYEIQLKQF